MQDNIVKISFTNHLRRFVELPAQCSANGQTVREIIVDLEVRYPGLSAYLIHENGKLRQHVNLFLDGKMISDRDELSDSVMDVQELHIFQALSGG